MPYAEKINRPELRRLMTDHQLTAARVAELLGRKTSTVQTWASASGVDIPDHALELLKYKLKEMEQEQ